MHDTLICKHEDQSYDLFGRKMLYFCSGIICFSRACNEEHVRHNNRKNCTLKMLIFLPWFNLCCSLSQGYVS